MSSEGKKNQLIKVHIENALNHLALLKNSARWKLGNGIISIVEKILLRKSEQLSIDKLKEHLQIIDKIAMLDSEELISDFKTLNFFQAVKIAFLVSDTDVENSIYGDTHVANDFKVALEKNKNTNAALINHKTKIANFDLIIAMLWDTKIELENHNESNVKIAWIRNYPERWIGNPEFLNYDLILCSSQKILDFINAHTEKATFLFPIAANIERFKPFKNEVITDKICFVGNKFKEERKIESILKSKNLNIEIYGDGWKKEIFGNKIKGKIKNASIPKLYNESNIILDAANETTTKSESLNSRIFNAIASKKIIITDSLNATSIFKYKIPTYKNVEELTEKINIYQKDDEKYKLDSEMLFEELKANHTFKNRAGFLKLILGKKLNVAIKIAPTKAKKSLYGDLYFAEDLKASFEILKHKVRIDCIEDWYNEESVNDDLVIVLRGLQLYKPLKSQTNFMWLISHPKEIKKEELINYDHIFVASQFHTFQLQSEGIKNVSCLEQCSNPKKFKISEKNIVQKNKLLFVGNSRNVFRKSVKFAIELGFEIDVFGNDWEQFIDSSYIKNNFVKNESLFELYNSYKIVLNDHWEDMLDFGYLSNRVFDVAACGSNILSDKPKASENLFPNLYYYNDKNSFKNCVEKILSKENKSLENYYLVNNHHTFKKRVESILDKFYELANV